MRRKFSSLLLVIMFTMTFLFGGCSSKTTETTASKSEKITVKDLVGREVTLNSKASKVVAIGPGALRLYCYVNGSKYLAGVEQTEKGSLIGKPYMMTNPDIAKLTAIGPGGPNNAPDPEKILSVKPDVIFTTYSTDKASADELQSKTNIPVVVLSYGKESTFDPNVDNSLEMIGEVTGSESRVQEVVNYIKSCKNDLDKRTKDIAENEKPSTYAGALSAKGSHGIESTQGNYSLFKAVHGKNVVDETGKTGSIMIDKEKLLKWNPDKIFIDEGGLQVVQEDYKKNPNYYNNLSAVKNGELYSQMPYNFYTTNIETAIADAYYLGKVLYPEKFKDIEPEKKADEIYKAFLGKDLYSEMAKNFGGFKKITLR
ncbi:iron ABC transporter substrate-binding protein [Clostridium magnum]|uniref:Iron-dicitrate transporter substrate-binding subunit n=1 Tax=Clostridium magnum DSM 2767 TaxID=1121326 RepID=A0A162TIG3_9CLOT|nr:iron ABC transporter substrate-binding protein [Clostridium magnum]KZL92685.1 iron-dicitrate transporter substrate-binding subunit [Clostridium magnum DSM 2767]SHI24478.1 iron complex transport system substrate-binding protein [Clostridium magnum DSM 2767]